MYANEQANTHTQTGKHELTHMHANTRTHEPTQTNTINEQLTTRMGTKMKATHTMKNINA